MKVYMSNRLAPLSLYMLAVSWDLRSGAENVSKVRNNGKCI